MGLAPLVIRNAKGFRANYVRERLGSGCYMSLTREELMETFNRLETELVRLEAEGQSEETLWETFERLAHLPAISVDQRDRLWWWGQLYSTMEKHGLTELSRGKIAQDFP